MKLIKEYRSGLLENEIYGNISIYDSNSNTYILSESDEKNEYGVYIRSVDKLLVVYCLYKLGLVENYKLQESDIAIMLSSHNSDFKSIKYVNNLISRLEIDVDKLVCGNRIPLDALMYSKSILKHVPIMQKQFNSCIGNHIALLLLAREFGLDYEDYWHLDTPVQKKILEILKSDFEITDVKLGYDRCGVPNRYMKMRDFSKFISFFSCDLNDYFHIIREIMHNNKDLIDGNISITNTLLSDPNIIAKAGADGIYAFGLKKERIGITIKGNLCKEQLSFLVLSILTENLSYQETELIMALTKISNVNKCSDNGIENISREYLFHNIRMNKKC